jgi:hypothetical protein
MMKKIVVVKESNSPKIDGNNENIVGDFEGK